MAFVIYLPVDHSPIVILNTNHIVRIQATEDEAHEVNGYTVVMTDGSSHQIGPDDAEGFANALGKSTLFLTSREIPDTPENQT